MYKLLQLLKELSFEPKYLHKSKDFKEGFNTVIKLIQLNAFQTGYANEYTLLKEEYDKYKEEKEHTIKRLNNTVNMYLAEINNLKDALSRVNNNLFKNKIEGLKQRNRKLRLKIMTSLIDVTLTDEEKLLKISLYLASFNDIEEVGNEVKENLNN